MLIFAIDDEPKSLSKLHKAIAEAAPEAEIMDFPLGTEAIRAIETRELCPDAVFTDMEMPELDGLALAVKLKQVSPASKIVFVTAYSEYAVEAIRQRISGYVLKPVPKSRIQEELEYIAPHMKRGTDKLTVRCFGQFDVFWQGRPLMFGRKQTKELLAFLVNSNGAVCTAEEIAAALWEEETDMHIAKRRIRQTDEGQQQHQNNRAHSGRRVYGLLLRHHPQRFLCREGHEKYPPGGDPRAAGRQQGSQ